MREIFSLKLSDVRGPVATTVISSFGISFTSSQTTSMKSFSFMRFVTISENLSLSTAKAPPAGTRHALAHFKSKESKSLISSFRSPAALSILSALKEFEHTSSAKPLLLCAGENFFGFISISRTFIHLEAICHAASHPAKPAPITLTFIIFLLNRLFISTSFIYANQLQFFTLLYK